MRVAVISTPFVSVPPPRYGGTELVVATLVDQLAARGHDVTLYATGDSQTLARLRYLYRASTWPPNPYAELNHVAFAVREIIREGWAEVIHAHAAPALAFAQVMRRPMVYTIHHERDAQLSRLYSDSHAAGVTMVAISARQRDLLEAAYPVEVVHHGLDARLYPLGRGGNTVAFLGRFAREKGVHTAIDVARRAGVPIRLAGKAHPPDAGYFDREVRPRLAKPGVTWLGEADHEAKVSLLGGALATLFPIEWEEPFGLVMIESMLCGTPVLALRRGSAPEIIDPGVTGFVVGDAGEMASRLLRLRNGTDQIDRALCQLHARRRFGAGRMAAEYLAIYARALGQGAVASGVR